MHLPVTASSNQSSVTNAPPKIVPQVQDLASTHEPVRDVSYSDITFCSCPQRSMGIYDVEYI